MLDLILLVFACICFGLAAANVKVGSLNLIGLGLLLYAVRGLL